MQIHKLKNTPIISNNPRKALATSALIPEKD